MELAEVGRVLAAYNYAESVNILGAGRLDMVLLDIHLPDRSGLELLDYIKAFHPHLGVIMISNQNSPQYQVLCLEKGADYFIDKSNDFEKIPHLITSLSHCS